jgi:quercetin dioxygenase-like cupin family protein
MMSKSNIQDAVETDGDKYSVVLENERVRVLKYHDKPGDRTSQHSHPDYVLYAESSFKRRLTFPDGRKQEVEVKAGSVVWMKGHIHIGENIGDTNTDVIIVELKETHSVMSTASSSLLTGRRILGFGKHPEIAAAVQEKLRSLGFQATIFVLTNDEAGDARLVAELKRAEYDGVAIGGYINGQDAANFPATEETTVWFNRVLNIVHANAPSSKIILVRGPKDVVPAIERVLGKSLPS